jgi:sulfate/thiosulfate transport system ATP-binding protein
MGIQVDGLSKMYRNFKAVDEISFSVNEGELAVLLGPSGSGKSTVLRMVAGLEKPDAGRIFLTGSDMTMQRVQNRNVGFVFQHYALFKHMTVEENIAFGLKVRKEEKEKIKQKVEELVDLVRLNGYQNHYPRQLSGGQRQRVALARALAPEPRILLLDEPFGALDARVRENLAQWLRNLHEQVSLTTILVTHDQKEAIEIADKIIVINRGKVEQCGNPRDVYGHPKSKFVASFVGKTNVITASVKNGRVMVNDTEIPLHPDGLPLSADESGSAVILVRPEDIDIFGDQMTGEGVNGIIENIFYRGNVYEININAGSVSLKTVVGKNEFAEMDLVEGSRVKVGFRDFTFFDAPEGEYEVHRKLSQLGYIE